MFILRKVQVSLVQVLFLVLISKKPIENYTKADGRRPFHYTREKKKQSKRKHLDTFLEKKRRLRFLH